MLRFGTIKAGLLSPLKRAFSKISSEKVCKIGCASGFWGDTAVAAPQLIHKGGIDFLVFDYLSEITMSLLAAAKSKDPSLGYTQDFVDVAIGPYLKQIKEKGIRVVANAGGINPHGCAAALTKAANKVGIDLDIAVVTGDDLMASRESLGACRDMDSGAPLPSTVTSINAYLGALPISRALDMGAQVVITGRCVDSAVTLGPLMHTFKWKPTDYDLLASGCLTGHLIECGAQVTGGIFTDYQSVSHWWNIGFPVAECRANGDCVITKPEGTGGLVSRATLCEQLVYEIADPTRYLLPDVTCDFSNVKISELEENRVLVTGAKGIPSSNTYKVSATYLDGYRITAVANVLGGNAVEKARRTGEEILKRVRSLLKMLKMDDFTRTHLQIIGAEEAYAPQYRSKVVPREAVIWLAAEHTDKRALGLLAREIAPAGTGMAPGLTGIAGGRPKISPKLRLHSFLVDKTSLNVNVTMGARTEIDPPILSEVPTKEEYPILSTVPKEEDSQSLSNVPTETDYPILSTMPKEANPSNLSTMHTEVEYPILSTVPKVEDSQNISRVPTEEDYPIFSTVPTEVDPTPSVVQQQQQPATSGPANYRLVDLAWARSGDKGNSCNVGVVARSPAIWPHLRTHLTTEIIGEYLSECFPDRDFTGRIERYELEGIQAVNFVLRESLGGGGIASLRPDPQGKGIAQMLLDLNLEGLPTGLAQ